MSRNGNKKHVSRSQSTETKSKSRYDSEGSGFGASLKESRRIKDHDEVNKQKNYHTASPKRPRCPIYMPRSEENLLHGKGLELIELLGEGYYSKVYLCKKTGPTVPQPKAGVSAYVLALKIIDASKVSKEYAKKFLPREISILMKISHPNIVKMYMLFQRRTKFYMCMRYAERGDLLEYLLAHGLITENRARFWTSQVASAVEYLHAMNVVHRDIKTENILITECFNAKLCDFGFSRFLGHDEKSSTYCGSISYSPPEILQARPYDPKKSDMWSFGVVIFVMLLKRLPFRESENPKLLLQEQQQKSYIMPPKMEETLSIQSKKVLKHLLEPNPKKRWSIQELLCSHWIAMDVRLRIKSKEEIDALEAAKKFAIEFEEAMKEFELDSNADDISFSSKYQELFRKKDLNKEKQDDKKTDRRVRFALEDTKYH